MPAAVTESNLEVPSQETHLISDWEQEAFSVVDQRHLARMALVQALFAAEFPGQSWEQLETVYDREIWQAIRDHQNEYDQEIAQIATERPISELAKIDLIIMRLIFARK